MIRAVLIPILLSPVAAAAGELLLNQPIDCALGDNCFIQQFVDRDPGPGAADFTCGPLSYDGHKGTDFALPSLRAMQDGVDVLSAAPGTVTALRNDMPDTGKAGGVPKGKDCGNGVVIRHGGGWETQYCHLKQGSVIVTKGQRVTKGTVLGEVGFSGTTEFPHLHLSVRKNGEVVDPFATDPVTCQTADDTALWQHPLPYEPGGLISVGLADHVPEYSQIQAGEVPTASLMAPALVAWGYVFGGQMGDEVKLTIEGPDGQIIDHAATVPRQQAQLFRAAGKKAPPSGWSEGRYTVTVALHRNGQIIDSQARTFELR